MFDQPDGSMLHQETYPLTRYCIFGSIDKSRVVAFQIASYVSLIFPLHDFPWTNFTYVFVRLSYVPVQPWAIKKQPHGGLISGISWWSAGFNGNLTHRCAPVTAAPQLDKPESNSLFDLWYTARPLRFFCSDRRLRPHRWLSMIKNHFRPQWIQIQNLIMTIVLWLVFLIDNWMMWGKKECMTSILSRRVESHWDNPERVKILISYFGLCNNMETFLSTHKIKSTLPPCTDFRAGRYDPKFISRY